MSSHCESECDVLSIASNDLHRLVNLSVMSQTLMKTRTFPETHIDSGHPVLPLFLASLLPHGRHEHRIVHHVRTDIITEILQQQSAPLVISAA